ncbi:MAG: hypothetical protein QXQ37_05750 [Nitrososphaerota archaeon]
MPRELQRGASFEISLVSDSSRVVITPTFDYSITLFRPLPVPITKKAKTVNDLSPCTENGELGQWFGFRFTIAEFQYMDNFHRIVLKHMHEGESVLRTSPIYLVWRVIKPYYKAVRYPDFKNSPYGKRIEPRLYEFYKQYHVQVPPLSVFDVAFIQSIVYVHKSNPLVKPYGLRTKSALVMLKNRSLTAFKLAITEEDETIKDVINLETGKLVRICRLGADKSLYPTSGVDSGVSYEVKLYDSYDNRFYASLKNKEEEVLQSVDNWEDVFNLYDAQEQLNILTCTNIPELFIFKALYDEQKNLDIKLPDSIIKKARNQAKQIGYNLDYGMDMDRSVMVEETEVSLDDSDSFIEPILKSDDDENQDDDEDDDILHKVLRK